MESLKNIENNREGFNINDVLAFTQEDIDQLNYQQVEKAQSLMYHSGNVTITDPNYINERNPEGKTYHPVYKMLIKRRAELEYPDSE